MSLYYTDPLKAVIMMRDHGVKINAVDTLGSPPTPVVATIDSILAMAEYPDILYYIHPESLPLFQLMVGDIWKSEQHIGYISIEGKMCANGSVIEPFSKIEILQRNGKQFYMAEGE
jgi:hypothetical protein